MNIKSTKGLHVDSVKCIVHGKSGSGKTTLIGTADNATTLIISAESGLLSLSDKEIDVVEINAWEELENGNYNIVVQGLVRVGFGRMIKDNPFRVAEMETLPEKDLDRDFSEARENLMMRLHYLAEHSLQDLDFSPLLREPESFVNLVNMVARVIPLSNTERYKLLAMDALLDRVNRMLWQIDDQIDTLELLKRVDPGSKDQISYN